MKSSVETSPTPVPPNGDNPGTATGDSVGRAPEAEPHEVRWRIDSKPSSDDRGGHKARFVPYITMERCADLLDDWVGPEFWWPNFDDVGKGVMWCSITIEFGHRRITKTDVGTGTDEMSAVSKAFVRCATRQWGIGRNVRHLPTVVAPCRVYTPRPEADWCREPAHGAGDPAVAS